MKLFNSADVEAAAKAYHESEMSNFDGSDFDDMKAALTAATASLEKRGGLFHGYVSYDGETGLPEVEPGPAFTTNQFPVAIIRLELQEEMK